MSAAIRRSPARSNSHHGLLVRTVVATGQAAILGSVAASAWPAVVLACTYVPLAGALDLASSRLRAWQVAASWLALDTVLLTLVVLASPSTGLAVAAAALPLLGFAVQLGRPSLVAGESVLLVAVVAVSAASGAVAAPQTLAEGIVCAVVGVAVLDMVGSTRLARQRRAAGYAAGRGRRVLDATADAIVVTTPTGTVTATNDQVTDLGHDTGTIVGDACQEALALTMAGRTLDCATGCPFADGTADVEVTRQLDGRHQSLLLRTTPVRDHHGRLREVVHALRDVTALRAADRAKQTFLATSAHELKTPVAVILGYASILQDGIEDRERADNAAATIHRRAGELAQLVERILLTARAEAGPMEVTCERLDVMTAIGRALDDVDGSVRRVERVVPDDVPPVVADHTSLTTVVEHLLENAAKFSPGGQPITFTVEVTANHVNLSVTDRGIGMRAEDAERCFGQFWRGHDSDTSPFGGSGLGLFIVRSLVEAMGGTVDVRSTLGEGTTFTVVLDRADVRPVGPMVEEHQPRARESMIREFMRQVGVGGAAA